MMTLRCDELAVRLIQILPIASAAAAGCVDGAPTTPARLSPTPYDHRGARGPRAWTSLAISSTEAYTLDDDERIASSARTILYKPD